MPVLLLAVAIAPGLFWLWYFLKRDHLRPEPRFLIRRIFFLGMGAGLTAAIIEWIILGHPALALDGGSTGSIITAASLIGLIEEGMKFLAVYLGVYRRTEFNEVLDGIVYAVAASMGFATLENVAYVLQGGIGVGLLRAVLSVPGHAFFAALMGFNMGMAKFAREAEWAWLISGWLLASLAHALYDAMIFTRTDLAFLVFPLVLVLWRVTVVQSRHARGLDDRRIGRG
jgi:RsiW-degrading membrane proteinase PrsW (M82 family)